MNDVDPSAPHGGSLPPRDRHRHHEQRPHVEAMLPPFNVVMVNPANRHAHVAYVLDVPVGRHDAARLKPLTLLAAIERGPTRRLGSDRGYSGLLVKNPLHPHWIVEWRRDAPYSYAGPQPRIALDASERTPEVWCGFPRQPQSSVFVAAHRSAHANRQIGNVDEFDHSFQHFVVRGGWDHDLWIPRTIRLQPRVGEQGKRVNAATGSGDHLPCKQGSYVAHGRQPARPE
jgi:hypothetical protein